MPHINLQDHLQKKKSRQMDAEKALSDICLSDHNRVNSIFKTINERRIEMFMNLDS